MKKLITLSIFAFLFYVSNAQETERVFKRFRVDLGMGYAIPSGPGSKIGFCFITEPKYAIQDQIQVGLRMESALMARGVDNANSSSVNISGNGSYTATGDYYFTTNHFRPFVGAGVGYCKTASFGFEIKDPNQGNVDFAVGSENKILGLIRTGFEFGHGRFNIEYNYIPKTVLTGYLNSSPVTIRNSYLSLNLEIAIGGGRFNK